MVSEEFIIKQTEALAKIDISLPDAFTDLQVYYGMCKMLSEESGEQHTKLSGPYKTFYDLYWTKLQEHSNLIMAKMEKDAELCTRILNSMKKEKKNND